MVRRNNKGLRSVGVSSVQCHLKVNQGNTFKQRLLNLKSVNKIHSYSLNVFKKININVLIIFGFRQRFIYS